MSKKSLFISIVVISCLLSGAVYWKVYSVKNRTVAIPLPNAEITDKNTVAHTWQWENFSKPNKSADEKLPDTQESSETEQISEEVPYDVVLIYDMLQQVRLDEGGNVIIDSEAKSALEKAFIQLGPDMGSYAISQLQELIQIGLPGQAGKQTAEILAQYYDYRLIEDDFLAQTQAQSMTEEAQNYEQLTKLRRSYLGHEVAEKLYAEEEIRSRHMFASMNLLQDSSLSDEEKSNQQEQLEQRLNQALADRDLLDTESAMREKVSQLREQGASDADIFAARAELVGEEKAQVLAEMDIEQDQWQQRYDQFWQERQQIVQSGLSETDQQQQIEVLLNRHFNNDEIARARSMQQAQN